MTCKPEVHTEQEAAQTLLGLRASRGIKEKPESAAFLRKHALGLSLVCRRVSFSLMQLPEASIVPYLRWALAGSLPSWQRLGVGARAHKAFSGPACLLPDVEHVWSWFPALAMTCNAPLHREQEAAQTLLVPMASRDLGEKSESAAFLNKQALGLSLVS